jgi:urease accessory protein
MRAGLLGLLQLCDSAFPTGAFSHSLGLETLVAGGTVRDGATLQAAIVDHLGAMATSDLPALRGAAQAMSSERVVALDRTLGATKLARETRAASAATGRSLLDSATALELADRRPAEYRALVRSGEAPGHHAVAHGVVCAALELPVEDAVAAFAYAACASLVAAGQKLVPLGQREAQRTLLALHAPIAGAVELSGAIDPADPYAFAPVQEVASMVHERQRTRLYIS